MIKQMENFLQRYAKLNDKQKQAVDHIEGPLLVLAGPGSGKTELLSVRIANILDKTDTLPSSILCLTFTDSAAKNMVSRLSKVIGKSAYDVAIHTFHSFGSEIISRYPEYFYQGKELKGIDEVIQIQILDEIFSNLPFNTPLRSHRNQDHSSDLRNAKEIISKLKSAGFAPADFEEFLKSNATFLDQTKDHLRDFWANINLRKKDSINEIPALINFFETIKVPEVPQNTIFPTLKNHLIEDLKQAYLEASDSGKTSPITKWKDKYLTKDDQKNFLLKDLKKIEKNFSFAEVYKHYQKALESRGYIDYDDMLIQLVDALKKHPDLRYNLQEKYLYFLIDEFQDTNGVQMEIVDLLSDSEIAEGNPNLFAVGDDDQSIFKFQGANIANILSFKNKYPQSDIIVLNANYRSNQEIISFVRSTILKGEERLENHLEDISKDLTCGNPEILAGELSTHAFTTQEQELSWVIKQVKNLIANGTKLEEIALITRKHGDLITASSYFEAAAIPVSYERRKDILKQKHITQLIEILRFLNHLSKGDHEVADHLLSTILTFDFWQIPALELWKISLLAFEKRKRWLEIMIASESEKISQTAHFLITLSTFTNDLTAEQIIDLLIGNRGLNISDSLEEQLFTSPYKAFYFPSVSPQDINRDYLELLSNLNVLIKKIRNFTDKDPLTLSDLIQTIDLHEKYSLPINDPGHLFAHQGGVNLITAHKSKGLEFKAVFVVSCAEEIWNQTSKDRFNMLPSNLPIMPESDNHDDVLRLFYVALSRAKETLYITWHQYNEKDRELSPLRFLDAQEIDLVKPAAPDQNFIKVLEARTFNIKSLDLQQSEQRFLKAKIQNYKLSITHLNDFIDLAYCGPEKFFAKNILRFPILPTIELSYGNAIHKALERFHKTYKKFGMLPTVNNLLDYFSDGLISQRLNKKDFEKQFAKGSEKLRSYYEFHKNSFQRSDLIEMGLGHDGFTLIDGIPIKGKIDRVRIDETNGHIHVFDYKTGKTLRDFEGYSPSEKLKAYKYKNQLVFYKLLIENSRNYKGKHHVTTGTLEFIDEANAPHSITYEITPQDAEDLKQLIKAVYKRIMALDFSCPDLQDPDFGDVMEYVANLTQE